MCRTQQCRCLGLCQMRRTGVRGLPESVQLIGQGAFFADSALSSVVLPSGIKKVEDFVMTGTSELSDGNVVPADTESIGRYAIRA